MLKQVMEQILKLWILVFMNEKGGVGKTTLATNTAAGFASRGYNVCLVDTDPQGHATISLNNPKQPGLYDLLIRDASWGEVLRPIPATYHGGTGNLYLVPSNSETSTIPLTLQDIFKLDTRLRQLEENVDVIIIDTPPSRSLLNASILFSADALIYPSECEYFSFDGLVANQQFVESQNASRVKNHFPPINVLGIVPTMMRNTIEHRENFAALQKRYPGKVLPGLAQRTQWTEASRTRKPIWQYAPDSEAAAEFYEILDILESQFNASQA